MRGVFVVEWHLLLHRACFIFYYADQQMNGLANQHINPVYLFYALSVSDHILQGV